jgi:hypothetical protein
MIDKAAAVDEHCPPGDVVVVAHSLSRRSMTSPRPAGSSRDLGAQDREVAAHLASLEPPWGHGIDASVFADVPTLVVTGGWNDEYEAIASRLANEGAEHVRLPGTGHRPQDHPGFEAAVTAFLRTSG